ncbi:MAG TPA: hypothetical protein VFW11_23490 [Cyclobacteriaceae bacterium]|nr:hypothetical protein [Cyclobacteriaceae bacterium]
MSKSYFEESQKFTQWWLWMLLLAGLVLFIGIASAGVYIQIIKGTPFGNNPMSDTGVIIFFVISIVFGLAMIFIMKSFHLETKVDRLGISYRFLPLIRKWHTVYRQDISEWSVVKECVFHYGIHYGLNSKTLNINGDTRLLLILASGKKLYLGTQKPEELSQAMQKLFDRQPVN